MVESVIGRDLNSRPWTPDLVHRNGQIKEPYSANENVNLYIVTCVPNMVTLSMKDVPIARV